MIVFFYFQYQVLSLLHRYSDNNCFPHFSYQDQWFMFDHLGFFRLSALNF
jgi:hypothetical protein